MIDKALILNNAIIDLDKLITNMEFDKDDWEYSINDKDYIISLNYMDAYNYEDITLEPICINEYGLMKYIISIESYDMDNELELGDTYYCMEKEISESKLRQIENRTEKARSKYLESRPTTLTVWSNKMITVENQIFNRECFNNITHYHYYYGQTVTLETRDFNDIEPFLILRDFFKSIKMGEK
jgi:hypothetical protein